MCVYVYLPFTYMCEKGAAVKISDTKMFNNKIFKNNIRTHTNILKNSNAMKLMKTCFLFPLYKNFSEIYFSGILTDSWYKRMSYYEYCLDKYTQLKKDQKYMRINNRGERI